MQSRETENQLNTYDQVPYPSYPLPQTHPRHLETIATLLGLEPPSSNNCRVLELGCGNGGNLIPMASSSSKCRLIGIDSSAKQIEIGKRRIELVELTNIELIHRSIEEIDDAFGQFDYILCHGVFSWVSQSVQSDILHLVRDRLVENGVGFISFNTYPGWHQRGVIRKMMRYHVERFPDEEPSERIGRARGLLEFLTRATPAQQTSYGMLLRENLEQLRRLPDAYLFHEHLEEFNEPLWFLDFCEMLAPVGLRYLADADFSTMMANFGFSTEARQELDTIAPNLLEKEQYLDFLRNRLFRQTLVCHDSQRPSYSVRAKQVFKMHIGSRLKPTSETVDFSNQIPQEFTTGSGMSVETKQPIFKAALVVLQNVWPSMIHFDDLLHQATELLQSSNDSQDLSEACSNLASSLLTTYSSTSQSLIEFACNPPIFAGKVSIIPIASKLTRIQAEHDNLVSNRRHESVMLTDLERLVVRLLDGNRSVDEVTDIVRKELLNDSSLSDAHQSVSECIVRLARCALLES